MKRCSLCGKRIWWWNELKITLTLPYDKFTHTIHDYHLKEGEILINPETGAIQKMETKEDV